jgi:hypothetical protein
VNILPESSGGEVCVRRGLGPCVLHHRASDRGILAVHDDRSVHIDAEDPRRCVRARDAAGDRGRTIWLLRRHQDRSPPEILLPRAA